MGNLKIKTNNQTCNCCKLPSTRVAVTIDNINFCHECLNFLKTISELNKTEWTEEVNKQSKFLKNEKSRTNK